MQLKEEHISKNPEAKTIVLFGGSQVRRQEVIYLMLEIDDFTIYGTLSEEEGLEMVEKLNKIDLILIGGRYNENQRLRIRNISLNKFPTIKFTEPGWNYDYENDKIKTDIKFKLNIK
jgi:hypothetical protein